MTHQEECPAIDDLTALLIEHGPAAMASALATLMNHAMQIEREQVLKAESHQRTADRQGYANGFKPTALKTRVGRVDLRIPQTRDYRDENGRPFYPRSLERGVRSERAMTLAVAEMYVQGVSTRKVTKVVEELCGLDITSTQVSRAAAELDEQLGAWRNRPIGEITYLILDARYEKVRHDGAIVPCALLTAIGIGPDGKPSSPEWPGNAASSISCKTPWHTCRRSACGRRSPTISAASSTQMSLPRLSDDSATSCPPTRSLLRNSQPGSKRTCQRPSPSFGYPRPIGGGSARPTGSSDSTKRSNVERGSQRCSRTSRRFCDSPLPYSPRSVTIGKLNVPT